MAANAAAAFAIQSSVHSVKREGWSEMENNLETKVAALTRQVTKLTQQLDEARRYIGLSPITDPQTIMINARRQVNLGGGDAA